MRSFLILLGVLLLPLPAFALSDSITSYCRSTNNPDACISSFIANEPYAKELAEFERRYAKEVADEKALDQSRKATSQQSDPRIDYCMTTRHPQDCIDSLQMDLRARQSEDLSAGQRGRAHQRDMQERQIEAQQDLAREQSRGMALFGSGQALINGMNQGFQNMQQPRYAPAPFIPITPPLNAFPPPIRCYSSNPGVMQTTTCY